MSEIPEKTPNRLEEGVTSLENASKNDLSAGELPGVERTHPETSTPSSPRKVHGISWVLVVLATLSSLLLYALDNTITANVIPVVVGFLGESEKLAWLSVGFMIGGIVVVLPFGKLYGLFNAKHLYLISVCLFMAGSALCGAAPTLNAFIVGRVIAGMGGNGMYFGVMTLLSVNTNDKERPAYLGLCGLIFGVGMVLGPIIGGAFAQSQATWRWSFYLNLCIGAVCCPICLFLLPGFDPKSSATFGSRFKAFDYLGALLSICMFVCVIMATNFGGTLYNWNGAQIIILFVVSGALFIAFCLQQYFNVGTQAANRIFPVEFLRMKEPVLLFVLMAVGNAGGFIAIYYIPTYFQFAQGDGPLTSAIRLLPLIVTISSTILVSGISIGQLGYYKPFYVVGNVLALIGAVLISRDDNSTALANVYGYQILLGVGSGAYAQSGYGVIQAVVDPSMMSYAISFMMLAQMSGILFGLSIAGSIFINTASHNLRAVVPEITGLELQSALLGIGGNFLDTLGSSTRTQALDAIVKAMQKLFVPAYVSFIVGLFAAAFLRNRKLASA